MKYNYNTPIAMYLSTWEVRLASLTERAVLHSLTLELKENMGARKYYSIKGRVSDMLQFWEHCAKDNVILRIEGENQPV